MSGWSPERNLWTTLQGLGGHLSWTRVDLDPNRSHLVSASDGVYLIAACPPSSAMSAIGLYTVLYAGQVNSVHTPSRNLRVRFREHIKKPNPKLRMFIDCYFPAVHFWFAALYDKSLIDQMEGLLIRTFNPPCNTIDAPGAKVLLARIAAGKRISALPVNSDIGE